MIELHEVTRSFRAGGREGLGGGTVRALEGVSLSLPAGGIVAVVGPNGAGKTTLFALALGFLRPTSGEITLAGLEPRAYARRHGAGYLPERITLPDSWTVRATLLGFARLGGLGRRDASARAEASIERFELGPQADRRIDALSRGSLQRLGLAQALLHERELVILDEPTQGLDPVWRIRLRELLGELAGAGRTVLLASHELAEVERVAARVVLIDDGRVLEVIEPGSPAGHSAYRLRLAAPLSDVALVFPGAIAETVPGGAEGSEGARGGASYLVEASGPAELSDRVAVLLESGAILLALEPLTERLEERVRRELARGADGEPARGGGP